MRKTRLHRTLDAGQIGVAQDQLPPMAQGPLDLHAWFETAPGNPLELEIGSGKGAFLLQQAQQHPRVNYIGIEYARAIWRYATDRLRRHGLTNVRLVHTEAGGFVRQYVPPGCLQQVHIYFPDPWPKARHHKRRLIQTPFLRELHRVLEPLGAVRLATDHGEYFQWMLDHAGEVADLFEQQPFEALDSVADGELVGSNFERKYRRQGRPFYAMMLRKRSAMMNHAARAERKE